MVAVAQWVRVPGCGPGGRGFESHQPPHLDLSYAKPSALRILILKLYIGASSSGKTTDFDSVIRWFKSSRPSQESQIIFGWSVIFLLCTGTIDCCNRQPANDRSCASQVLSVLQSARYQSVCALR